jgi:hypothetical protein
LTTIRNKIWWYYYFFIPFPFHALCNFQYKNSREQPADNSHGHYDVGNFAKGFAEPVILLHQVLVITPEALEKLRKTVISGATAAISLRITLGPENIELH